MTLNDSRITRMKCSDCGRELNPHAEKPVEPRTREEAQHMDAALGGIIEEIHTCPDCGRVTLHPSRVGASRFGP